MDLLRCLVAAGLMVVLTTGCATVPAPASADVGVSFDVHYSNLSPHGSWLVSGSYGRVWQPAVYNSGWNPYYDGRWIYTDVGWTWVSDYEWGAVPYHYGTWVVDSSYGWVWVPGSVWAPSWVVFRTGPDYIGWAPVPVGYSVGMSFSSYSADSFVFVASRDFLSPRVGAYVVSASNRNVIINNTRIENTIRIENNVVINTGPDVNIVQRASGKKIEAQSIERVPRVGPGRLVSRADLRVDAARSGGRVRATEPISARESEGVRPQRGRRPAEKEPVSEERTFSSSDDPQMQPDADSRQEQERLDRERDRGRAQQRQSRSPEPEGSPQERGRRFSPSADPQTQPDADSRQEQERLDRERDRGRAQQRQRRSPEPEATPQEHGRRFSPSMDPQMQPGRGRPKDQANESGTVSPDDSKKDADAKAKAEAKEKEKAKAKEKNKKKEKPKPTPSDDKPPQ